MASAAEIVALDKDELLFRVQGAPRAPIAATRVRVCISVLPEQAFDLVLQKCTELGAAECQPMLCAHTVARMRPDDAGRKCARWQRICDEAAVQSGSAPMRVLPPAAAQAVWPAAAATRLLADQSGAWLAALPPPHDGTIMIAIGPEGGFADAERAAAVQHGWHPVALSPHTLRAETAAVAACARLIIPHKELPCLSR